MKVKYTQISDSKTIYSATVEIDEPEICPMCKHSLKPSVLYKCLFHTDDDNTFFYSVYFCTKCHEIFICKFSNVSKTDASSGGYAYKFNKLDNISPNIIEKINFDKCINEISPDFVNIYNQSFKAEHLKLDQISGIGYRKALEFLIKDFLIKHECKDESKVKSTALGCCIDTMIDNPQLKTVASRATWLGNDQTHYEQKYTDNDISDLKKLITLSVHWISMICLTDEAELIEKK